MVAHNCHGKTENLKAKTKTSRQNQVWGFRFCREVFCFCREVFGFAVRFSVLPWGILFLQWGFWFCRDSCGPRWKTSTKSNIIKVQNIRRPRAHQFLFEWPQVRDLSADAKDGTSLCSQINSRMTEFVVSTKNHYKISFVKRFALENTPAPKTSNFLNSARQSRIEYIFLR